MDIVIPFRNTCGTLELDTCVHLIYKNLKIDFDNIIVIGDEYKNDLVTNIIIDEQKYNKWLDSSFLVKTYIEEYDKPFILFNDDFFLTDEVTDIPHFYYDTLSNRLKTTFVIDNKINKLRQSAYGLNIMKFISLFGDYENYEVHIPMIIEYPTIMKNAIDLCKEKDCPALKRTMYMKMVNEHIDVNTVALDYDVKFGEPLKIIQKPFFSLTDTEINVFKDELQ